MMGAKIKGAVLITLAALFMASCEPSDSGLREEFDRSGEELHITVIFHPSQQAVDSAYREQFGRSNIDRLGFAVFANPGNRPYWCTIHAQKPTRDGDEKMATLGHELTHCLVGRFHDEPKK
jgi:hypothetical protein